MTLGYQIFVFLLNKKLAILKKEHEFVAPVYSCNGCTEGRVTVDWNGGRTAGCVCDKCGQPYVLIFRRPK